jgi:hypothetical protein
LGEMEWVMAETATTYWRIYVSHKGQKLGASYTNIENVTENFRNIISCNPHQTSSINVWG